MDEYPEVMAAANLALALTADPLAFETFAKSQGLSDKTKFIRDTTLELTKRGINAPMRIYDFVKALFYVGALRRTPLTEADYRDIYVELARPESLFHSRQAKNR